MVRDGFPIETVSLRHSVRTGVEFGNISYPLWDAAIAAGATLEELQRLDDGVYSSRFQAKLVAWHKLHQLIELHSHDAAMRKAEKEAKKKRH